MESARAILAQSNGSPDKVCRKLFGPVDHKQLKADYERILGNTIEEAKHKWNFDFVTETPLEGNYKWERVDFSIAGIQLSDAMQEEKENPCMHCGQMVCPEECREAEYSQSEGGKRKQTLITDYYQVKRRCSPDSSPKPSCS